VTRTDLATQTDVGAEPVDEPVTAAARVAPTQSHDVAEQEIDHAGWLCRH
jgi:hypothetical protein